MSSTAPAPGAAVCAPAPCSVGGLARGSMAPSCAQLVRVPTATCVLGAILPVLRRAVATTAGVGACGVVVVLAGDGCPEFGAAHGVGSSPCPAGAPTSPHSAQDRAGPILRPCPEARCPAACPTATCTPLCRACPPRSLSPHASSAGLLRPILQGLQASGRCLCGLRGDRVRGSLVSWGTCEMLAAPIRWLWCSAWMERGGHASSAPCSCASGMGTGAVVPFIGCVFLMHFGSLRAAAGEPIVVMELGLAAGAWWRVRM